MMRIDEAALQDRYVQEGTRLGLTEDESRDFIKKLWPKIEIGEELNGVIEFHITPTAFANFASCCIGADANYRFHTGRRAINQSSVLINICCAVICRFAGGILERISPDVTFETALKVGEVAILYASVNNWENEDSRVRITNLRGETESGQVLLTNRIIRTKLSRRDLCQNK